MIVFGIKEDQIPPRQIVLGSAAPQMAAAAFYKADDVAFVKMIGEFLYDAAQLVCLDTETAVVEYMALFL